MNYQSLFLPTANNSQLHVMNLTNEQIAKKTPILMIHGIMEDGRIFYHKSGKGIGCFLAQLGYQVYIADLRGIGQSTPKITRDSSHGQTETITEDIPSLINFVLAHSQQQKLHLIAHSWGGVNLNSALVRFPDLISKIISGTYFGTKRRIMVKNIERLIRVDLLWNWIGLIISKRKGYLPSKSLKIGPENETYKTHHQCIHWIKDNKWIDPEDGFNYDSAAKSVILPPILYIAAIKDHSSGHRSDVKLFRQESGEKNSDYLLLSKKNGHQLNYGHTNMLTAPEAVTDHFPTVLDWLCEHQ